MSDGVSSRLEAGLRPARSCKWVRFANTSEYFTPRVSTLFKLNIIQDLRFVAIGLFVRRVLVDRTAVDSLKTSKRVIGGFVRRVFGAVLVRLIVLLTAPACARPRYNQ